MPDDAFSALADRRRRDLLAMLARGGPRSATALARDLPVTRQAVVKHLGALESAGLVRRERDGREVRFVVIPEALGDVTAWIETVSDRWQARLERMRAYVEGQEEQRHGKGQAGGGSEDVRAGTTGARIRRVRDRERLQRVVHERRRVRG